MYLNFTGKVVLVTGSSSGIGAATAVEFAKLGAKVVITSLPEHINDLKDVEEKCQKYSSLLSNNNNNENEKSVLSIVGDVTNDLHLNNLISCTIKEFGQLDILVNNVGIALYTSIFNPNVITKYDQIMNTNLTSIYKLTHLAVPHLIETKGNIINISSIGGTKPHEFMTVYCMGKAALDMFTQCLALELGPKGVRVNCVKPGVITTNIFSEMGMSFETEQQFYKSQSAIAPLRRNGSPEDIANLIVFLASSKAINMTGSLVVNDSGAFWGPEIAFSK